MHPTHRYNSYASNTSSTDRLSIPPSNMPTTQKKSKKTRLQLLAEQMTQLQQEISSLQRKQKKPHRGTDSLPKPKRLIPKPPGTAVQHAMGLGTDKRQYNALMNVSGPREDTPRTG
ncbi:hypothetical protein C8R48DRAFT_760825 [Suillus tomentosus]|nr:hypothetical protein C8R48DRAFT_760825 [Suillus tomentosus]